MTVAFPRLLLRESIGFKTKELSKADKLAEEHRDLIIQKWNECFN